MGQPPPNDSPPNYSQTPPLPFRQQPNAPLNSQQSRPQPLQQQGTGALVGELAERALKGLGSAIKTGAEVTVAAVSAVSTKSQPYPSPQPASVARQQMNYGYQQGPPGFQPAPQGYPPAPQGYPPGPQGFQPAPQGYPPAPQGFQPYPQGYQLQNGNQYIPFVHQPYKPEGDYWKILADPTAWYAVFYFIIVDLIWCVFCFTWCLATMIVGICLLVVFPVGYPLLFLFSLSWRALAHANLVLLYASVPMNNPLVIREPIWIPPVGMYERDTFPFRRHIFSGYTWKSVSYFIFYSFLLALWSFIFAVFYVALFIPCVCVAPASLSHLRWLLQHKRRFALKLFA